MIRLLAIAIALVGAACSQNAGPDLEIILADKPAVTLSDYGLFKDEAARVPAAGVVKYDLINPLF